MKNLYESMENKLKSAETEIKTKRILSGMQLFDLKKGYVVLSKQDYDEMLEKLKSL